MDESEILEEVQRAASLYLRGQNLNRVDMIEQCLEISLHIREVIDGDRDRYSSSIDQFHHLDGGLNANIFNCMKLIGHFDGIIPYLEKTLEYLNNADNPDLWRQLGLLYLVQEKSLDKACDAWRKSVVLSPTIIEKFPGLNIVYTYDTLKSSGHRVTWEILHADLETGDFSVSLKREE